MLENSSHSTKIRESYERRSNRISMVDKCIRMNFKDGRIQEKGCFVATYTLVLGSSTF